MATADKLITVAENVPKVYHSGQLNIVKNAECLKSTKSDTSILIDDVSPVTHEMGVRVRGKNLFSLANRTWADFGALANTTVRNINKDNFYFKISANNYVNNSTTDYEIIDGNSIKITTTNAYGLGVPLNLIAGQQYTISCIKSDNTKCRINIGYYDIEGNYLSSKFGSSTFTMPENAHWAMLCFVGFINSGTAEELTFTNIQLELGSTATAYTPYVPDLTAVKVSRCGKNLTNSLTDINAKQNSFVISRDNGIVTLGSKNVITYSSMAHLYDRILSAGTYTFSFDCTIENIKKCTKPNYVHLYVDDKFVANVIYDMNKDGTYHRSFNFKITKKSRVLIRFYFNIDNITEASDTIITKAMFSNVQLELGSTATEYEPYITPTDYTPTADGTVNGVTSLYPNTTLMTDTDGVIIDCEYYKDVDKAFDELTTSVALSGGDS